MWSNLLKHAAGVQDGWDESEEDYDGSFVNDGAAEDDDQDSSSHHTSSHDYDDSQQQQPPNDPEYDDYDDDDDDDDDDDEGFSSQQASDYEAEGDPMPQERPPSLLASAVMTPGGGGRFMGRLTAFIEQVTQADDDDEEEADEEDRNQDDGELDYDDYEHEHPNENDVSQEYFDQPNEEPLEQNQASSSSPLFASPQQQRSQPLAFFTPAQPPADHYLDDERNDFGSDNIAQDNGWEDDDLEIGDHDDDEAVVDKEEDAAASQGTDAAVMSAVNLAEAVVSANYNQYNADEQQAAETENAWDQDDLLETVSVGSDPAIIADSTLQQEQQRVEDYDDDAVVSAVDMAAAATTTSASQQQQQQQQSHLYGMKDVPGSSMQHQDNAWAQDADDGIDLNMSAMDMLASAASAAVAEQQHDMDLLDDDGDENLGVEDAWGHDDTDLELSAVNLASANLPDNGSSPQGDQDDNAWEQDDIVLELSAMNLASAVLSESQDERSPSHGGNAWQDDTDLELSGVNLSSAVSQESQDNRLPPHGEEDENAWEQDNDDLDLSAVNLASAVVDNDLEMAATKFDSARADVAEFSRGIGRAEAGDLARSAADFGSSIMPNASQSVAPELAHNDGWGQDAELDLSVEDIAPGDNAWEAEQNADLSDENESQTEKYGKALAEIQEDLHRLSYDDEEEEIYFEDTPAEADLDQHSQSDFGRNSDALDSGLLEAEPSQAESSALAELEAEMQNLSLENDFPPTHVELSQLVQSQKVVVVHTPEIDEDVRSTGQPSISVLPDASSCSSSADTPQNPYDTENETEYGPIVDHTPKRSGYLMNRQMSVESMGVAIGGISADDTINQGWEDEDEEVDDKILEEAGDTGENEQQYAFMQPPSTTPTFDEHLVDHTPAEIDDDDKSEHMNNTNMSVGVLVPDDASTRVGEDDRLEDFGLVVDHTPIQTEGAQQVADPSVFTNLGSTAVHARILEDDYCLEETDCGDESADANAWDDVDDDLIDGDGSQQLDGDECVTTSAVSTASSEAPPMATSSVKFRIEGLEEVHIVDHIPRDMDESSQGPAKDPSLVALVTEHDLSRDTGNCDDEEIYDDENDFDFGPVVDQTPPTPGSVTTSSALSTTAYSMAVLGEESEFNDDAMDDTAFGDSTVGGGTYDGGTEGWEQVELDTILEGVQNFVVDHTPSEFGSPSVKPTNSSVMVMADANSTKEDDTVTDNDGSGCNGTGFGPVVDLTPQFPVMASVGFREDSVAVQAQDLDTIDETNGYDNLKDDESDHEDGGEYDVAALSLLRSPEDLLVDHIPLRPDRYGDASTMVAADPSEVMSEVDDMVGIEDNFGPVVDQIPPTRPDGIANLPSMAESASGSTVAFAPASLAADDLDVDDNGTRFEETEEFPNPQSGGDDDEEVELEGHVAIDDQENEQVVDILPPDDDIELPDIEENRETLSELTVGGAQSLLLPLALDTTEGEFGPVVDQLPQSRSGLSLASTATQLTASEYRVMMREDLASAQSDETSPIGKAKVVIDHLPRRFRARHTPGSNSSIGESQLPEDEDEEEENGKFGPIVDQLPTSTGPSCGGSTVDAMANVSEAASDDDEEADAWDEDADVDVSESGVSDGTALRTAMATRMAFRRSDENERNVSVRFETHVDTDRGSSLDGAAYYDMEQEPESGDDTMDKLIRDPISNASVNGDSWADVDVEMGESFASHLDSTLAFPKSFAEADTPPSTPYRRYEDGEVSPSYPASRCSTCENVNTVECPCIRKLLHANRNEGVLIGKVTTPEGDDLELDYSKLLEHEMIKRRLVEQESIGLRAALESKTLSDSIRAAKEAELKSEISDLQRANYALKCKLVVVEKKIAAVEEGHEKVGTQFEGSCPSPNNDVIERDFSNAQETVLKADIETLNMKLNAIEYPAHETGESRSFQEELLLKSAECTDLTSNIAELRTIASEAEQQRVLLKDKYEALELAMQQATNEYEGRLREAHSAAQLAEKTAIQERETQSKTLESLSSEIEAFRSSNVDLSQTVASLQCQHENDLKELYQIIEQKTADARELEILYQQTDKDRASIRSELSKQRSLADQSEVLAVELLAVTKERDVLQESLADSTQTITSLQRLVDEHGIKGEDLDMRRETEIDNLKAEVTRLTALLAEYKAGSIAERDSSLIDMENMRQAVEKSEAAHKSLQVSLDEMAGRFAVAEDAKTASEKQVESLQNHLLFAKAETQRLDGERQKAVSHLAALGRTLENKEKESEAQRERLSVLETELIAKQKELSVLASDYQGTVAEHDSLLARCERMESEFAMLLSESEQKVASLRASHQDEVARYASHVETLSRQVTEQTSLIEEQMRDHQTLALRCSDAEAATSCAIEEAKERHDVMSKRYEQTITEHEQQHERLTDEVLRQQAAYETAAGDLAQLQSECAFLRDQVLSLQDVVHGFERDSTRWKTIENDLTNMNTAQLSNVQALTQENDRLEQEKATLVRKCMDQDRLEEELDQTREKVLALSEENEEMLVQFALIKQQMDASEEHVAMLQQQLESLQQSNSVRNDDASAIESLVEEKSLLLQQLTDTAKEKVDLERRMASLICERDRLANAETAFNAQRIELLSQIDLLKREKHIDLQLVSDSDTPSTESEALNFSRKQCDELQKEVTLLREQLKVSSARVDELDRNTIMLQDRDETIAKLQAQLRTANEGLSITKDQLGIARATLAVDKNLDSCAAANRNLECTELGVSDIIAEFVKRIETMQRELEAKESALNMKSDLVHKLQESLSLLQDHRSLHGSHASLQLAPVQEEPSDKLKAEFEAVTRELTVTRDLLTQKENELAQFSSSGPDECERIDDVQSLRSHIISLAVALERSETKRAESIAKLIAEREASAESLRRLSESVKRFYSSVSYGDV